MKYSNLKLDKLWFLKLYISLIERLKYQILKVKYFCYSFLSYVLRYLQYGFLFASIIQSSSYALIDEKEINTASMSNVTTATDDLKQLEEEFDLGEEKEEIQNNFTPNTNPSPDTPAHHSLDYQNNTTLPNNIDNIDNIDIENVIADNYFNKAIILATNKITAKSQIITININSSAFFGNIEIFPLKCWKSPNKYNPESKAFLKVIERKVDDEPKSIFNGWMFSSSVSISTLEHPIYEVSLIECTGQKILLNK